MNPTPAKKSSEAGTGFLIVLILCTILSVGIAGYLSSIRQQMILSSRSQSWNIAMAIVEAGIEEGLEHLNSNHADLGSQGWTTSGNTYSRGQVLADGNSYQVSIDNSDPTSPAITARAFVNTYQLARNRLQGGFFAAINQNPSSSSSVARAVRVRCSRGQGFTAAAVAKHNIDLNGNGVLSDSYDSGDPLKSTNTRYDAAKYTGDLGDIATNEGIDGSVSAQNANIYGHVMTGPGCPVTLGPNGGIGTHAWQAGNTGIQPGFVRQDANFTFPDTTLPSIAGLFVPPSGEVAVATYAFGTNAVTTLAYPNPVPAGGVATNTTYLAFDSYPNPVPSDLVTNSAFVQTATKPDPAPANLVTNYQTVSTKSGHLPAEGTYLGGVTTNGSKYQYNLIIARTYSYTKLSYVCPSLSYTYSQVGNNVTYTTNHFENIVYANTTNFANSLSGNTLIAGPNACLILPNGLTGAENFTIAQGGSVLIYSGGSSLTVSGNQVLNPNGYAGSFMVFCAPSVTSFTLNGNGEFTGVVVGPNADLKLNGGGSSDQDFCGSMMVNSIRLNGHFKFHYDEALKRMPGKNRFLVSSWDEISPW